MQTHYSCTTLSALIVAAIRRHGQRPAVTCNGQTVSYAELDRLSNILALALRRRGVQNNDVVALHMRNSIEYIVADLAILKLGAAKCPLNELMSPAELGYCLNHAGVKLLIRHASLPAPDNVADLTPTCIVVSDGPGTADNDTSTDWNAALAAEDQSGDTFAPEPVSPSSRAIMAYTGGTTGQPKCVVHNQERMGINLLAQVLCGDVRNDEVMLLTTPLPHSAGYHMQACLFAGGHAILEDKFSPDRVLKICESINVTWMFAVPTMLYRLLDAVNAGRQMAPSLRTVVYGAAPMGEDRLKQGLELFGPVFIQLYGQTECPNYICTLSKEDHLNTDLLSSCGKAVPFCDVTLLGEGGKTVPVGDIGELTTASPYLLVEYHNAPEQTANTIVDGRLRTGDLAYQNDDGYIFLVDRTKDMIITGGMNVYSVEVENAIRQHARVSDAAVIGAPDPDWGEAVIAVIVSDDVIEHKELKQHLAGILSAYKIPKTVHRVDALPLTRYGKIDKKRLRQMHLDAMLME